MKYTLLAETLKAQFLSEWKPATEARIKMLKELNAPSFLLEAAINSTPGINEEQAAVIRLVTKLDTATSEEKIKTKRELKFFHFTLKDGYNPPK